MTTSKKTSNIHRSTIFTCAVVAVAFSGFGFARQANADVQDHLHKLAANLEDQANVLIIGTRHYRHTPHYRQMVIEATRLRDKARHIHLTTYHGGTLRHLKADLAVLDACFHELEEFFDHVEHDAFHGVGHIHGSTRRVADRLRSMEDAIHHMMEDVQDLERRWGGRAVIQAKRHSYHDDFGHSNRIQGNHYGHRGNSRGISRSVYQGRNSDCIGNGIQLRTGSNGRTELGIGTRSGFSFRIRF